MKTGHGAAQRRGVSVQPVVEALVLGVEEGRVRLRGVSRSETEWAARIAVPGYHPTTGDRVLVQEADSGTVYVTGVVHAAQPSQLVAPSGARATVEGQVLALFDPGGALVASLDGATGELRISATSDLELSAPAGRVILSAGVDGSKIELTQDSIALASEKARVSAGALAVDAVKADWAVGQWELRAGRVIERAMDVFHDVEGLLETRAGRLRTLVSSTLELLGRRTTITSEKDTRIDGERVLLG
ncbi:DUF3540 domain-containing protein [Sorangium sp. So ce1036]|uniref:DUF3540 domain-containing protein n=1 Tax=Sorangium sp. So ce1036 TaxID=3133328 RepID=UPI003F0B189C